MLFRFLEKPIEITFNVPSQFTYAHTYNPVSKSSKFVPSWWKNIPNIHEEDRPSVKIPTVKTCLGIIGTFQNGYILPLWSDLSIKCDENGCNYKFSDGLSHIEIPQKNFQRGTFYEDFHLLKINSPWVITTSEELKFIYCDPFYTYLDMKPYIIPYGIVPSVNKFCSTNIFMFLKKQSLEILIEHQTPLLHIIPLTDRQIIFKTRILESEEWTKLICSTPTKISFVSKALKQIRILKEQKNG